MRRFFAALCLCVVWSAPILAAEVSEAAIRKAVEERLNGGIHFFSIGRVLVLEEIGNFDMRPDAARISREQYYWLQAAEKLKWVTISPTPQSEPKVSQQHVLADLNVELRPEGKVAGAEVIDFGKGSLFLLKMYKTKVGKLSAEQFKWDKNVHHKVVANLAVTWVPDFIKLQQQRLTDRANPCSFCVLPERISNSGQVRAILSDDGEFIVTMDLALGTGPFSTDTVGSLTAKMTHLGPTTFQVVKSASCQGKACAFDLLGIRLGMEAQAAISAVDAAITAQEPKAKVWAEPARQCSDIAKRTMAKDGVNRSAFLQTNCFGTAYVGTMGGFMDIRTAFAVISFVEDPKLHTPVVSSIWSWVRLPPNALLDTNGYLDQMVKKYGKFDRAETATGRTQTGTKDNKSGRAVWGDTSSAFLVFNYGNFGELGSMNQPIPLGMETYEIKQAVNLNDFYLPPGSHVFLMDSSLVRAAIKAYEEKTQQYVVPKLQ